MKVLKFIIVFFAVVGLIIMGIGFAQPDTVEIKKEILIDAPIDVVFDQIDIVRNWSIWLPLAQDSSVKFEYSSNPRGEESWLKWKNNYGSFGKISIERSDKNQYLLSQYFIGGNEEATMEPYFETVHFDGKVRLTMAHDFQSNWYDAFGKFYNNIIMKDNVIKSFEYSLEAIKKAAEVVKEEGFSLEIVESMIDEHIYVVIKDSVRISDNSFEEKFPHLFSELFEFLAKNEIPPFSPPTVIRHSYDEGNDKYVFSAAILIHSDFVAKVRGYELYPVGKGKVLEGISDGYFSNVNKIYDKLDAYIVKNGIEKDGEPIETYTDNNPFEKKENTQIFIKIPIK